MFPARSWCSASHDAGLHEWIPKKTGGLGLRRGLQFAQSLLPVAHQPRACCIRLVQGVGSSHLLETTLHSLQDIPSTINTHNTKCQMITVHINNTKHITIANISIPPQDTTSTHYKTANTDIQHCIQHNTNIQHVFSYHRLYYHMLTSSIHCSV